MTAGPLAAHSLGHAPSWSPTAEEVAEVSRLAAAGSAGHQQELRWWEALAAGRARDWDAVSSLAEVGLAEPFSERESIRLAFLHCLAGVVEEAEHLLSQAIQLHGDAGLARTLARWCDAEGLEAAAARLRLGPAGPAGPGAPGEPGPQRP